MIWKVRDVIFVSFHIYSEKFVQNASYIYLRKFIFKN